MITKNTRIIEFLFYLIIIFYFLYSGEIYNFFVPENTQMKLGLFRDWKIVVNDIYCVEIKKMNGKILKRTEGAFNNVKNIGKKILVFVSLK